MAGIIVATQNLMQVYVDISLRRTLNSLSTESSHDTWYFSRGDTLKGTIYTVSPTGVQNPLWNQFNVASYQLALTDGLRVQYCTATGWEAWGGTTNPHQTFDLAVSGPAIDAALGHTLTSISATLEIEVVGIQQSEGSSYPQSSYIVHDFAMILATALNPVP